VSGRSHANTSIKYGTEESKIGHGLAAKLPRAGGKPEKLARTRGHLTLGHRKQGRRRVMTRRGGVLRSVSNAQQMPPSSSRGRPRGAGADVGEPKGKLHPTPTAPPPAPPSI
jgi:hypothetical protein